MALSVKSLKIVSSRTLCQTSINVPNVLPFWSSSMYYSTIPAEAEEIQTPKPLSEMPGLSTASVLKEGFLKKISRNKENTVSFDSKKTFQFWFSLKAVYGPTFKMSFIGKPTIVAITNPDDIDKLYRITMAEPVRLGLDSLRQVRLDSFDSYFGNKTGILLENYDEWRRVRSKLQTPVMRPKNIVRYLKEMDNVSRDFTDRIAELQQKYGEMPENFQQEIYKWALESVGTVALNRRLGCLNKNIPSDSEQVKIINSVNRAFELLNVAEMEFPWWKFFPTPMMKEFQKHHDFVLRTILSYIKEAEKEFQNKKPEEGKSNEELTLLENLLQTEGLTRKDVVTFMHDMFLAGIDTTSHTIGFTLYLLSRNKDKQRKLQEEVDAVLGDGQAEITEKQLANLSYLKACLKESLRIFPLAPGTSRLLQEDAVLGGYLVPKGYSVFALNLITGRDEQYFKQAKDFIPERWMRDMPLGPIHPYASLPFSHGIRMCIGRRIAEQEMYTLLARIMHRFNIDYKYEDMDIVSRMVAVPSEPLRFEFTERR